MLKLFSNEGQIEISACGSVDTICADLTVAIRTLYHRIKESNPKEAEFFAKQLKNEIPDLALSDNVHAEMCERLAKRMGMKDKKEEGKSDDKDKKPEGGLSEILSALQELVNVLSEDEDEDEDED